MPTDQNSQSGRRQHFHRRRGPDKRGGGDRRPANAQPQDQPRGDGVDVDQIMREIRARIAQRHGIDLSSQQIQELAARRLEAILDPRTIRPSLLEQLRKSAGAPAEAPRAEPTPAYSFEDDTLFESQNGLVRTIRRLLNPVLKLLFNPNPLIQALNTQARLNKDVAKREEERDRRQAEWNALHYTILQRLVVEVSRVSIEAQSLGARVESLGTRIDFNDRRVRGLETTTPQPTAPYSRPVDTVTAAPFVRAASAVGGANTAGSGSSSAVVTSSSATSTVGAPAPPRSPDGSASDLGPDGTRRRRRRRRGRRSGPGFGELGTSGTATGSPAAVDSELEDDSPETGSDDSAGTTESSDAPVESALVQAPAPPTASVDAPPAFEHAATPAPVADAVAPATLAHDGAPVPSPVPVEHLNTDPRES